MQELHKICGCEEDVNSFTTKQREQIRKNFTQNISCSGVKYNHECLVFYSISTYKNWRYYAGLEYIGDDEFNMASIDGEFCAVFFEHSERVQRILEILIEKEEKE